jgi:hypothetical protein
MVINHPTHTARALAAKLEADFVSGDKPQRLPGYLLVSEVFREQVISKVKDQAKAADAVTLGTTTGRSSAEPA